MAARTHIARGTRSLTCIICSTTITVPSTAKAKVCGDVCRAKRRSIQQKAWKVANADRVSAKGAERYDRVRDDVLAYNASRRRTHADLIRVRKREYKITRNARERDALRLITQRDLNRARERYRGCAYCPRADGPMHWDHVMPLARGGLTSKGNLVPACESCNLSKGSKTVMEWRIRLIRSART